MFPAEVVASTVGMTGPSQDLLNTLEVTTSSQELKV